MRVWALASCGGLLALSACSANNTTTPEADNPTPQPDETANPIARATPKVGPIRAVTRPDVQVPSSPLLDRFTTSSLSANHNASSQLLRTRLNQIKAERDRVLSQAEAVALPQTVPAPHTSPVPINLSLPDQPSPAPAAQPGPSSLDRYDVSAPLNLSPYRVTSSPLSAGSPQPQSGSQSGAGQPGADLPGSSQPGPDQPPQRLVSQGAVPPVQVVAHSTDTASYRATDLDQPPRSEPLQLPKPGYQAHLSQGSGDVNLTPPSLDQTGLMVADQVLNLSPAEATDPASPPAAGANPTAPETAPETTPETALPSVHLSADRVVLSARGGSIPESGLHQGPQFSSHNAVQETGTPSDPAQESPAISGSNPDQTAIARPDQAAAGGLPSPVPAAPAHPASLPLSPSPTHHPLLVPAATSVATPEPNLGQPDRSPDLAEATGVTVSGGQASIAQPGFDQGTGASLTRPGFDPSRYEATICVDDRLPTLERESDSTLKLGELKPGQRATVPTTDNQAARIVPSFSKAKTCPGGTKPLAQIIPEAVPAATPVPDNVESPTRYSPETIPDRP